jgi:hypothetical protein
MALSVKDGIPLQICKTVSYSLQLTPVPRSTKYGNAASKKVKNIDLRSRIAFSNEEPHTPPSQSNGQGALNLDGCMLLSELAPLVNAQGGTSDYLAKPVTTEHLLSAIRMWQHH